MQFRHNMRLTECRDARNKQLLLYLRSSYNCLQGEHSLAWPIFSGYEISDLLTPWACMVSLGSSIGCMSAALAPSPGHGIWRTLMWLPLYAFCVLGEL